MSTETAMEELAEQFHVRRETVKFWASPANKRRDANGKRKVAERV